jgi:hypothetical protein
MDAQMKMSPRRHAVGGAAPVLWIGVPVSEDGTRPDHPDHVHRRHLDLVVAVRSRMC